MCCNPLALAISITAVVPSPNIPNSAVIGLPNGPKTSTLNISPLVASIKA